MIQTIIAAVSSILLIYTAFKYIDTKDDLEFEEEWRHEENEEKWKEIHENAKLRMKLMDLEEDLSKEAIKREEIISYVKEMLYALHKEGKEEVSIDYKPNGNLKDYDVQIEDDIIRYSKIIKLVPKYEIMK